MESSENCISHLYYYLAKTEKSTYNKYLEHRIRFIGRLLEGCSRAQCVGNVLSFESYLEKILVSTRKRHRKKKFSGSRLRERDAYVRQVSRAFGGHPSKCQFVSWRVHPLGSSFAQCTGLSIQRSVYPSVQMSVHPTVRPSIRLPISVSVRISARTCICQSKAKYI